MKVGPGIILKLFLNFSNFEPQYSYRLYSYKKSVYIVTFHTLQSEEMLSMFSNVCFFKQFSILVPQKDC